MLILKQTDPPGHSAAAPAAPLPVAFIVGVTRSGTTLLRMMLDSHPAVAIPPETHFIPDVVRACDGAQDPHAAFVRAVTTHPRWDDFQLETGQLEQRLSSIDPFDVSLGLRAFYTLYAERFGKPRWSDKTPAYVYHMLLIQQLLPEARFVHMIRDGRDAALSIKDRSFGPNSIEAAAQLWVERLQSARNQMPMLRNYFEVRYEDLVLDSESTLKALCPFLELPWDDSMLRFHERAANRLTEIDRTLKDHHGNTLVSAEERIEVHALLKQPPRPDRVQRWRHEMTAEQRIEFERIGSAFLREFGYEV